MRLLCLAVLLIFGKVLADPLREIPADVRLHSQKIPARYVKYQKIAEAANAGECANIGKSILKKGGSAVDSAIAMLLCDGAANPHSMGIGGGFLMTIWDGKEKKAEFLNARETAPAAATENMFAGNATLSFEGALSIAVPGEIKGYWEAHQKYGKLPWADLFRPTIDMCRSGSYITNYVANYLRSMERKILENPSMKEVFINPATGRTWVAGEKLVNTKLADTLEKIAQKGASIFYEGEIAKNLAKEIQDLGGIITEEDFKNYQVKWRDPIKVDLGDYEMYTAPPPGSGIILAFILNVLHTMIPADSEEHMWQRIVETFKWAYARRTEMGDPDFVDIRGLIQNLTSPEYAAQIRAKIRDDWTSNDPNYYGAKTILPDDAGTAHFAVIAEDGSAVSVTSTINHILGSMVRSPSTGIILNDEMDDFSSPGFINAFGVPPSVNNFIKPGKRPVSSMSPTIILDKDKIPRLVIGSAGGTKITTSVAVVSVLNLWAGYNLKLAMDAPRLHHQLFPMQVSYEPAFNKDVLSYLKSIGHKVELFTGMNSTVVAAAYENGFFTSYSDQRREGRYAGERR